MSSFGNSFADDRAQDRKLQFKNTVDPETARRLREGAVVQIRKEKKHVQLAKRRQAGGFQADQGTAFAQNSVSNLDLYIQQVNSNDSDKQLEATKSFRKMLSVQRNPPIEEVIATGVVPRLVEFLKRHDDARLQFEALWALTNIASGTSKHTMVVTNAGAVPIFVQLLKSPHPDVCEQAVWALGNVAGDSSVCRDRVLFEQGLLHLIALLDPQTAEPALLRNGTWALSNFCRGKPPPQFEQVAPCIPTLAKLIQTDDEEVLTDACWALSYLTDGRNQQIDAVLRFGVVGRLIELLHNKSVTVQTPALRTVGNIVTGNDEQTQMVINANGLRAIVPLLSHHRKGIRKEACWAVSNITAGVEKQIQSVIDVGMIPMLVDILRREEFDVQKEAAWAISNATSGGNQQQIAFLVESGCIPPLCNLLEVPDSKVITVALEGLENILKVGEERAQDNAVNEYATVIDECEGVAKLEVLVDKGEDDVMRKANHILERYFEADDEDEMDEAYMGDQFSMPPPAAGGNAGAQQQFNFGGGGFQ